MKSTDQKANKRYGIGGIAQGLAGIIIGALAGGLFLWIKKVNPMEEKISQMENEKDQLEIQLHDTTTKQIVVEEQTAQKTISWNTDWIKLALSFLLLLLSLVGPVMVILHRWVEVERIVDLSRATWCQSDFLCQTILPSYFMYFFFSFLGMIGLILVWRPKITLPAPASFLFPINKNEIPESQRSQTMILGIVVTILLLADITRGLLTKKTPGFEYIFLIAGYLLFSYLREFRWDQIGTFIKRIPSWSLLFLIFIFGVLSLLRSMFEQNASTYLPLFIMIFSFVLMIPNLKKIPAVLWISTAGLLLYSLFLGSWRYSIIGDEYSFFGFGSNFLKDRNFLIYTLENFLNPSTAVHGKFVYMSLIPNILSMEMFGAENFGWRIVNTILCCASVPFFYGFVKRFMNKRLGIIFSILIVGSHALLSFSKIGYNNLTALFAMSVIFWITGKVLDANYIFSYAILGAALGLGLYSYTAIFAVLPLPFLLVLIYNPPFKSKRSAYQWLSMIIVFSLFLIPTLCGSDFWKYIQDESTLASGHIRDRAFHIYSNLLYTFASPFYAPENTHYVSVSYLDALSGALLLIGLIALIMQLRKNKFAWFILLSYLFLFISLGVSRDRALPNITHFFLYLPIWWLIVVSGIDYLSRLLFFNPIDESRFNMFQTGLMIMIVLVNLVQAYVISPENSKHYYNHEALFLRFLMQADETNQTNTLEYLYLTDAYWNVFGLMDMQAVYQLPAEKAQLMRSPMYIGDIEPDLPYEAKWVTLPAPASEGDNVDISQIQIESWAFDKLDDPETIIVTHPVPQDDTLPVLIETMAQHHRGICELRSQPGAYVQAMLWIDEDWMWLCPQGGMWKVNW